MSKFVNEKIFVPLLFLFAALVWRSEYYVLSLYVAIPVFIAFCFTSNYSQIIKSKYFVLYLFLMMWMVISSFMNDNPGDSFRRMVPITAGFLLSFSAYSLAVNSRYRWILLLSYLGLFGFLIYSNITANTNFSAEFDYSNEFERKQNMKLDANDYAYYLLFASMCVKLLIEEFRRYIPNILKFGIYVGLVVVSFYTALMTASRQVLTLQIPLVLFFLYYDFRFSKKGVPWWSVVLVVLLVIWLYPQFSAMYSHSFLSIRSEVGFQDDVRENLFERALMQGLENPVVGIGLGCDTFFSHSTYTHLFARTGFLGFLFFVLLIFKQIRVQWLHFKKLGDSYYFLCFVLLLFLGIGHFLYSYIDEPFMMAISFIIIGCSDRNLNKRCYNA